MPLLHPPAAITPLLLVFAGQSRRLRSFVFRSQPATLHLTHQASGSTLSKPFPHQLLHRLLIAPPRFLFPRGRPSSVVLFAAVFSCAPSTRLARGGGEEEPPATLKRALTELVSIRVTQ